MTRAHEEHDSLSSVLHELNCIQENLELLSEAQSRIGGELIAWLAARLKNASERLDVIDLRPADMSGHTSYRQKPPQ